MKKIQIILVFSLPRGISPTKSNWDQWSLYPNSSRLRQVHSIYSNFVRYWFETYHIPSGPWWDSASSFLPRDCVEGQCKWGCGFQWHPLTLLIGWGSMTTMTHHHLLLPTSPRLPWQHRHRRRTSCLPRQLPSKSHTHQAARQAAPSCSSCERG